MALVGDMNYLTIDGDTYEIADAEARNDILLKAPLASPDFTGTPTAPTAASGDSSTQIATTAFVQDAMSGAGAGTVTSVGVSNATNGGLSVSGSPITTNGTITVGHSNVLSSAQSTQAVYPIKIDKNGHISGYGSAVTSMPASDVSAWAKEATKPTYTYSEVGAAAYSHTHGNITDSGDITATAPTIASGDQIIINDNSESKITNGPTFDGSTTTKALTQKGTWETFLQSESDPVFSASAAARITATDINSWNDTNYLQWNNFSKELRVSKNNVMTTVFSRSDLDIPTKTSDLTNDSGFITSYTDEKLKTIINNNTNQLSHYIIFGSNSETASTKYIDTTGLTYSSKNGTPSVDGDAILGLGNSTGSGTAGNKQGILRLNSNTIYNVTLKADNLTNTRTILFPDKAGTIALTSDIPAIPTTTGSATTGISIANHSTGSVTGVQSSTTSVRGVKTGTSSTTTASKASGANGSAPTLGDPISVIGVQSSTTSVTGVQSSTTTASKVTVGSSATDYGVTDAGFGSFTSGAFNGGSGSFSATVTSHVLSFSHTHTAATHGADSHTHTAPTLGSKMPTVSASDVTVPIKATSATTVPIKATSATEIPNVTSVGSASTWSFTDVTVPIRADSDTTVPIKDASASTFVTGTTHTITDNGHTHSI